jgi:hypothetical protein
MQISLGREARSSPFAERAGFAAGLALISSAALVALAQPLLLLFRIVPRSYNEGWNAFWADAAARSGDLYAPADSLITNNYPPLSFHLIGLFGRIVGDNVIAGRLVSLTSFVCVVLAAFLWLRAAGVARQFALTGAVLLFATFSLYGNDYVAMNDPQMLGHALMLAAMVLLWRFELRRWATVAGAALMLLGGFTKHLLIPLPLAVTFWMACYRREAAALWFTCLAAGVPCGLWLTWRAYPSFIDDLLSSRVYVVHQAVSATRHAVARLLPLLALGAVPIVRALRDKASGVLAPRMAFVLMYLSVSLVTGAIAGGGEGVTRNAFFDLVIASSLFAALGLEWMWNQSRQPRLVGLSAAPAAIVLLAAGTSVYAVTLVPETLHAVEQMDALEEDTRAAIQMLERLGKGRAACETLALCYWARSQFTVDFFTYGQKLRTGALPVEPCKAALQRGDFPVLQLEPARHPRGRRLWPCSPAIEQYYTEAFHSRIGTLLVPKSSVQREVLARTEVAYAHPPRKPN